MWWLLAPDQQSSYCDARIVVDSIYSKEARTLPKGAWMAGMDFNNGPALGGKQFGGKKACLPSMMTLGTRPPGSRV